MHITFLEMIIEKEVGKRYTALQIIKEKYPMEDKFWKFIMDDNYGAAATLFSIKYSDRECVFLADTLWEGG